MRHLMAREGFEVGRDQVARLMRVGGVSGATRGRHPQRKTFCDPAAPRHPDLVNRNWAAQPARTSRGSPTSATSGRWRGLVCVSFVTDVDSPQAGDPHWRILGWRVSARKETGLSGAAAGAVHPTLDRIPFHNSKIGSSPRRRQPSRIAVVVATPRGGGAGMGRPAGWSARVTGRPSVRSPWRPGAGARGAGGVLGRGRGWCHNREGGC